VSGNGCGIPLRSDMAAAIVKGTPPNKRLKLAGGDRSKEAECCALAHTNYRSTTDAPAGESPAA